MRAYLAAHAEGRHMHQFGWKTFRVLVVTTEQPRTNTMIKTLQRVDAPLSPGRLCSSLRYLTNCA